MNDEAQFESTMPKVEQELLRRKGHCNMCGMCCRAIRLNKDWGYIQEQGEQYIKNNPEFTEEELKEWAYEGDTAFIYYFWEPITKEEAFKINPHLKTWYQSESNESYYYRCKQFDSESNKCKVHESGKKPHVCTDYPYYGGNIGKGECFYSPNCGYKIDIEP